jgi:hypothetical protein
MKQTVYQHKSMPWKSLVTDAKNGWVEFYQEDEPMLKYLEEAVFLEAYTEYAPLDKPLYKSHELKELRQQARSQGILVPKEFQ